MIKFLIKTDLFYSINDSTFFRKLQFFTTQKEKKKKFYYLKFEL